MTYAKLITSQVSMYQGWIDGTKAQESHARMGERIQAEFPDGFYHESAFNSGYEISYRFKSAAQLERLLSWLRGNQYKSRRGTDSPADKCRTFAIYYTPGLASKSQYQLENRPDITLKAYFLDDDATCKYVKVGTKAIAARAASEVDVFELQCDDPTEELAAQVEVLA